MNRYATIPESLISLINEVSTDGLEIDIPLTKKILSGLIATTGVQLPMASTILRFKNPKIYQIIDQRVYRILYGRLLQLPTYKSIPNIQLQIDLYLKYLTDLRVKAKELNIPFEKADRILYEADKRLNKNIKLKNYG